MKKLIILILITISAISLSKAQSEVAINMEDFQAEIFNEPAQLTLNMTDMHLDAIEAEISDNLANMPNFVDLSNLESLPDAENLNFRNITANSPEPEIGIVVSDTNAGNVYAYVKGENSFTYSSTTNETPQNNDALFSQLSNIKGIQVVYISKSMLGMMPDMNMPGVDIGNIAGKLESLEIYTAEEELASKRLANVSEGLLKGGNYETLMLIKDNDSKTGFYIKKNKSNQGSEMLMITEDDANSTIIRFLGNFTVQDIKNLANQGNNMNINTSDRLSEKELNIRIKEAQKRNEEAQKIAKDAEKRAIKAQKQAEEKARAAEERARKAN